MSPKSYRDAVARAPTTRNRDPDETEALSEKQKAKSLTNHKSLPLVSEGPASSSAPASPSASASVLKEKVPVEKVIPCDSSHDVDPASHYHKSADTDASIAIDRESVDDEFRGQSKPGGVSRKDEEKIKDVEPLVLDDGEIICECLEKNSKKTLVCPEKLVDENGEPSTAIYMREVFAGFRKTEAGRNVDTRMTEAFISRSNMKGEKTVMNNDSLKFTRVLLLMNFQADNSDLKDHFSDPKWRKKQKFPKITNETIDYYWWEENFDPKIVQRRLKIMEEVTKKVDPQRKYFLTCQNVSRLNTLLHPPVDLKTVTGMAKQKKFVLGGVDFEPTIFSMVAGGSY